MTAAENKKLIESFILDFVKQYEEQNHLVGLTNTPVIGFAAADDPEFDSLKIAVHPEHHIPTDSLPTAKTVISYFIPLTKEAAGIGQCTEENKKLFNKGFGQSKGIHTGLFPAIQKFIEAQGYEACLPIDAGIISDEILVSRWSQKHVGKIAGIGNMGINTQLITIRGCLGSIGSIITSMPIEPSEKVNEEYCLYKRNGTCGVCQKRCPSGALGMNNVKAHVCRPYTRSVNSGTPNANKCLCCSANLPCSTRAPI